MPTRGRTWEAALLAFGFIFTVLLGVGNVFAAQFGGGVPLLAILLVSIVLTLLFRYWPERRNTK